MAYELSDDEWGTLESLLPKKKMGRPYLDLRRTVSGIKWVLKTGSSWRALPLSLVIGTVFTDIFVVCNKKASLKRFLQS